MKVTLISTLLNEASSLGEFLEGIDRQTRPPDEVVIVDGGSTDGSLEMLRRWAAGREGARIESVPGANISAGRNAAIERATGDVIAVTDAGCTLDAGWLAALVAGFEQDDADVVMGFYAPDPRSRFERILACLNLPDAAEVDAESFMPSSRSVAFRKETWEQAGRYPEWLAIGEDMLFNFRVRDMGARRVFAPDAVVRWRLRPDLASTMRQYFRYGEGDGRAGMYPQRHALRFATYAGAGVVALLARRRPGLVAVAPLAAVARMRPAYRRAFARLELPEALLALAALPALELAIDLAKMAGYLSGRIAGGPPNPAAERQT
ncbi:MAG TPA: glycosyltransferase [Actinomycetota bacterium]|nr:glycosyltransferase [Actinomycetota bacterium]